MGTTYREGDIDFDRVMVIGNEQRIIGPITIAQGESLSDEIDIKGTRSIAVLMPDAWTTADLIIRTARVTAGTTLPIMDSAGNYVGATAAASQVVSFGTYAADLSPARYIRIQSVAVGSRGTAVAQAAARTLYIIAK